ncbi:MAG: GNAT family N-acetyltransferase [bacterium]|nr:GNAT family N-acetyltransferase [bacterium]
MKIRELKAEYFAKTARCYALVFAGPPWNEACLTEDTMKLLSNPHMKWWVAVDNDEVVGFCAGWTGNSIQLAEKLGAPVLPLCNIGYQAELGVMTQYRNQGVARKMAQTRLNWFKKSNVRQLVIRSKPGAVTYDWNLRLGFSPAYVYPDGRVILTRSLEGLSL